MKTVDRSLVDALVDFAPTSELKRQGFAEGQAAGTAAAFNMLARNRIAYLADEVGMGKTYVALGVMGLLRHLHPRARVVVLTPRANIQSKWIKEQQNFCRHNWRVVDNRVRSLQDGPARPAEFCDNLPEMIRAYAQNAERDMFLRMHSFSVWSNRREHRKKERRKILDEIRWIQKGDVPIQDRDEFRVSFGAAINAIVPEIDLLVVDEAHNLKHGFSEQGGSTRNALLATALGRPLEDWEVPSWYGARVKRLLLLSATPFEYDYADLWRQLDLFGFGDLRLADAEGARRRSVRALLDEDLEDGAKRELVRRFLLRRVSGLRIGGELYTKNMYRREWRKGGFEEHDHPLGEASPRERLVVGLVQKKVAEVLQHERFNNHFQIGMLSSFESFLESAVPRPSAPQNGASEESGEDGREPVFDGRQTEDRSEQEGVDRDALAVLGSTYRARFGEALPHPKMDAAVRDLSRAFETGDKVLVFVRRVATMGELKAKLDRRYDAWLERRMLSAAPELAEEFEAQFRRYERARRGGDDADSLDDAAWEDAGAEDLDPSTHIEEEESGTDTFFAWFFRGKGPPGVLSGAAFQKNRLSSTSSAYSLLFEDDLVSWLLGRPEDVLGELAATLDVPREDLVARLRQRAFVRFRSLTEQKEGYPRLYVFEAYQAAALELLQDTGGDIGEHAGIVLHRRFSQARTAEPDVPPGFPGHETGIGVTTVPTVLAGRRDLEAELLPAKEGASFEARFLDRQRRLELLSRMARLGACYIDLYLLAIRSLGSLRMEARAEGERPAAALATRFVDLLQAQRGTPGMHAYAELSGAAAAFGTLLKTNFPDVPNLSLAKVPTAFGRWLQSQSPVMTPRGAGVARLVRQFRMPGYPLVVISTDVLQEGEDLHTFCRKVVHYGITWTPSAMEQRTGRVDRIGGLVQRRWDGSTAAPEDHEWIQVHYPHLAGTVERLQVDRVFERMNRFLRLTHRNLIPADGRSRKLDVSREIVAVRRDVEQIKQRLESAFEPDADWMRGALDSEARRAVDCEALYSHLRATWAMLRERVDVLEEDLRDARRLHATLRLEGGRVQPVELELRTQAAGDHTVLRCASPVGLVDLDDPEQLDELYDLRLRLEAGKICAEYEAKHRAYLVTVESSMLFDPKTSQASEVERTMRCVTSSADSMEAVLLQHDASPDAWLRSRRGR